MEQRNGRIDRKLQPHEVVRCHYFFYKQRPEDRVIAALVRKTKTTREELGSLAQVIDGLSRESVKLEGATLTLQEAIRYLALAGGDRDKARELARAEGHTF